MPPLPSVLPMTAITRSASKTPSSMSLASSDASLTLCSGTLRTSIGAGTWSLFLRRVEDRRVLRQNGADVVAGYGVGDVLEGRDDGSAFPICGITTLDEAEGGLDLGAHRAPGELACGGVLPQLRRGHPAQRALVGGAEIDH